MSTLGSSSQPLRVAIIGSGPAGFYAAEALFKAGVAVQVDMFDRLPTPFGLVRGGVAPDHPKIKNVTRVFERIASQDGYEFVGNVMIGRDVEVAELREYFDAVIFCCGAETDRRLNIPGEDLPGSHTATEFVGWYNGHPDYRDRTFDLSGEVAAVIGQGNVAMDVSRILAKTPDELRTTDIAQHAFDALCESKVRTIYLVGRRGPVQAKFTPPEIREMGELANCDPVLTPEDLDLDEASQAELDHPDSKNARKNLEVLRAFAGRTLRSGTKRYHIRFHRSPVELRGDGHVRSIVLERNRLTGEPFQLRAEGTGETEELPCDLVFRSVGYRGVAIPGVPFDEKRGVMPNIEGRILDEGVVVPGLYAAGWIKRGPSGIIGTNKPDSVATVQALLADLETLQPAPRRDSTPLLQKLHHSGARVVTFGDWSRIDAAEVERGRPFEKPREKFTRIEEMLRTLD